MSGRTLLAGAKVIDISPNTSQFLLGYPHVNRMIAGVHDPIYASALALECGGKAIAQCATDICCITRETTAIVREKVGRATGLAPEAIVITATHTHSAPNVREPVFDYSDKTVPIPDPQYLAVFNDGISRAIPSRKL